MRLRATAALDARAHDAEREQDSLRDELALLRAGWRVGGPRAEERLATSALLREVTAERDAARLDAADARRALAEQTTLIARRGRRAAAAPAPAARGAARGPARRRRGRGPGQGRRRRRAPARRGRPRERPGARAPAGQRPRASRPPRRAPFLPRPQKDAEARLRPPGGRATRPRHSPRATPSARLRAHKRRAPTAPWRRCARRCRPARRASAAERAARPERPRRRSGAGGEAKATSSRPRCCADGGGGRAAPARRGPEGRAGAAEEKGERRRRGRRARQARTPRRPPRPTPRRPQGRGRCARPSRRRRPRSRERTAARAAPSAQTKQESTPRPTGKTRRSRAAPPAGRLRRGGAPRGGADGERPRRPRGGRAVLAEVERANEVDAAAQARRSPRRRAPARREQRLSGRPTRARGAAGGEQLEALEEKRAAEARAASCTTRSRSCAATSVGLRRRPFLPATAPRRAPAVEPGADGVAALPARPRARRGRGAAANTTAAAAGGASRTTALRARGRPGRSSARCRSSCRRSTATRFVCCPTARPVLGSVRRLLHRAPDAAMASRLAPPRPSTRFTAHLARARRTRCRARARAPCAHHPAGHGAGRGLLRAAADARLGLRDGGHVRRDLQRPRPARRGRARRRATGRAEAQSGLEVFCGVLFPLPARSCRRAMLRDNAVGRPALACAVAVETQPRLGPVIARRSATSTHPVRRDPKTATSMTAPRRPIDPADAAAVDALVACAARRRPRRRR